MWLSVMKYFNEFDKESAPVVVGGAVLYRLVQNVSATPIDGDDGGVLTNT